MLSDNPYEQLGVPRDASDKLITKRYRELAKKWHPDKQHGADATPLTCSAADTCVTLSISATEAFAAIGVAYNILSDPEKRNVYDRLGGEGLRRLQDGDPRVRRGYLPPDEVLRRHLSRDDPPMSLMEWAVTSAFAWLEGKPHYD